MMAGLGFHEHWIEMMMACVSFVRYKVRFNSQKTEVFVPTKGIRQGDPISPYMFMLCAESLSSLLQYEEEASGLKESRCAEMHHQYQISYLLMFL